MNQCCSAPLEWGDWLIPVTGCAEFSHPQSKLLKNVWSSSSEAWCRRNLKAEEMQTLHPDLSFLQDDGCQSWQSWSGGQMFMSGLAAVVCLLDPQKLEQSSTLNAGKILSQVLQKGSRKSSVIEKTFVKLNYIYLYKSYSRGLASGVIMRTLAIKRNSNDAVERAYSTDAALHSYNMSTQNGLNQCSRTRDIVFFILHILLSCQTLVPTLPMIQVNCWQAG